MEKTEKQIEPHHYRNRSNSKPTSLFDNPIHKLQIHHLLSTFSNKTSNETTQKKKNKKNNNSNFSATTIRGIGCKASASKYVSVPAVIRTSADWQEKKQRRNSDKNSNNGSAATCVDFQDVWCGPGIGFSVDAAAASSLDCVVARKNVSARGNLDVKKITHMERPSYLGRNTVKTESISIVDDYSDIFTPRPGVESFGTSRCYGRVPHLSSDGFAEQLLELGEKIGYVNTGLEEDEMGLNVRKLKLVISNGTSENQIDMKCTICQEEYEGGEELGVLNCEHSYHFQCIKQWLEHKNFCPVCTQEVVVRQMPKS